MENSKIQWTDHTFNPWIGCAKVSPGCANCYAETMMDKRYGRVKWGVNGTRTRTSASYWRKPITWNRATWTECPECGWRGDVKDTVTNMHGDPRCPACLCGNPMRATRQRVFCGSLCDVFEDRDQVGLWRVALLELIKHTPNIDWLLLTKRPENITRFMPMPLYFDNIWLGTSVEDQSAADERIPHLLKAPAKVRFLSCEPLLGDIEITQYLYEVINAGYCGSCETCGDTCEKIIPAIHWVIAGCESGENRRQTPEGYFRSLRDQCWKNGGVSFFLKQMEVDGHVAKMPALDGQRWAQFPEVKP